MVLKNSNAAPNGRCHAKSKRSGCQCRKWPMRGKTVCHIHGGKAWRPPGLGHRSGVVQRHLAGELARVRSDSRMLDLEQDVAWVHVMRERGGDLLAEAEVKRLAALDAGNNAKHGEALRQCAALQTHIARFSDRLSAIKERRHRILHGERMTISLATVDQVLREVERVISEWVGADKRDGAIAALVERLRHIPMRSA